MSDLPRITIRRARRTDFGAVAALAGASERPSRRELRRFRSVVADLGCDFYLAVLAEAVVGYVHVSYVRQLFASPRARIEELQASPGPREREIRESLLRFARERALRRGCTDGPLTS